MGFATLAGQIGKKGPFRLPCHLAGGKEPDVETILLMVSPLLLTHSLLAALSLFGESRPLTALVPLELRQVQLGANGLLSPLHVRPRALDLAKLPGANHLRRKHTLLSTKSASYVAKIAQRNRKRRAEANKWGKSNH